MKKSIILVTLAVGLSLVACSPKKETSSIEKQIAESIFNEQVNSILGDESKEDKTDVKCDESATLICINGIDINVLDWVNDTSEAGLLDYLAENGQILTASLGINETFEGKYTIQKEQETASEVLHKYLRPPYVYIDDGKYHLALQHETGCTFVLYNDTEDGHSKAFLRDGIFDDSTIGSKKYTVKDLNKDTENKLKSMFTEVVDRYVGYDCYLGDFEKDGYRIHANVQGKGEDSDFEITYIEYTVYFKNMANELDEAVKKSLEE